MFGGLLPISPDLARAVLFRAEDLAEVEAEPGIEVGCVVGLISKATGVVETSAEG